MAQIVKMSWSKMPEAIKEGSKARGGGKGVKKIKKANYAKGETKPVKPAKKSD
jgi:hypothetical protein